MKRLLDLVLGLLLLLISLPLMGLIGCAIACDSGQGILFSQLRIGHRGKLFRCYKFRTMCDDRVTPLGRILRRASLDELPQLWNVLCGEMSLVGPRPYLPREVDQSCMPLPLILSVLPGLTGLWQIRGRKKLSLQQRIQYDVDYVTHRNLKLDLRLLMATIPCVLAGRGAY